MADALPIAFPFVQVTIDTRGLMPVAQRAAGVLAIVGVSGAGDAEALHPVQVSIAADVDRRFGADTALARSLKLALAQDPGPSTVYGVKIAAPGDVAAGLRALEAADDVTFVAVAETYAKAAEGGGPANAGLVPLLTHCETMSREGHKRIGLACVDPDIDRATAPDKVAALAANLKSDAGRMILIAARGARDAEDRPVDVAAAAAAAIAGLPVAASIVLKPVRGFRIPVAEQYAPSEIRALAQAAIVPVIDPALIVGESLHFAEGTLFTTDATLRFVDTVRLLDDIDFALRAGLVGLIGDARITRTGLRYIVQRAGGVLDRYVAAGGIDDWSVDVPVLAALEVPEAARPQVLVDLVKKARAERVVEMGIRVVLGPQTHLISIALEPTFA